MVSSCDLSHTHDGEVCLLGLTSLISDVGSAQFQCVKLRLPGPWYMYIRVDLAKSCSDRFEIGPLGWLRSVCNNVAILTHQMRRPVAALQDAATLPVSIILLGVWCSGHTPYTGWPRNPQA